MVYTIPLVGIDIVALFYFLNRFSTRIWRPFYQAIAMLQRFDVQRNSKLRFLFSNVDEFNTLNNELPSASTDKVTCDYRNLREFTENMSHETQTPLAIIRSKLEIIMQSDNPTPEQMNQVAARLIR